MGCEPAGCLNSATRSLLCRHPVQSYAVTIGRQKIIRAGSVFGDKRVFSVSQSPVLRRRFGDTFTLAGLTGGLRVHCNGCSVSDTRVNDRLRGGEDESSLE
jgi:hypothetical protein